MIKTLYKCFQHWSDGGSVYIISDCHFGDTDMNWRWALIRDYPWPVLDWMDQKYLADCIADYIIWKINKTVHRDDTLIVLGDVGDVQYIKKLTAKRKVLVKGNHDAGTKNYIKHECWRPHCKDSHCDDCKYYKGWLFDEVYEGPLFISEKIVLSHEPLPIPPEVALNIHGHDHSGDYQIGPTINVCAEKIGYTPLNLGTLIKAGVLRDVPGLHRLTIDKASGK